MSAGSSPRLQLRFLLPEKAVQKKKVGGVLVITCLGQLQLSVHVIEHLHSELEPAGQKAISLSLRMEAPRWHNGALTPQHI